MIIELLTRQPNCQLSESQAKTFQLLLELENGHYSLQEMLRRSNLFSPLPFWSRLRHLEAKGLIRTSEPSAIELPSSSLLSQA